jgi:hypothetical protein
MRTTPPAYPQRDTCDKTRLRRTDPASPRTRSSIAIGRRLPRLTGYLDHDGTNCRVSLSNRHRQATQSHRSNRLNRKPFTIVKEHRVEGYRYRTGGSIYRPCISQRQSSTRPHYGLMNKLHGRGVAERRRRASHRSLQSCGNYIQPLTTDVLRQEYHSADKLTSLRLACTKGSGRPRQAGETGREAAATGMIPRAGASSVMNRRLLTRRPSRC